MKIINIFRFFFYFFNGPPFCEKLLFPLNNNNFLCSFLYIYLPTKEVKLFTYLAFSFFSLLLELLIQVLFCTHFIKKRLSTNSFSITHFIGSANFIDFTVVHFHQLFLKIYYKSNF